MNVGEIESLPDDGLIALSEAANAEIERRNKIKSPLVKANMAFISKRDPRCPTCWAKLSENGKRHGGVQTYACPGCGTKSSDASNASLASSKLPLETIRKFIAPIMLDCPDRVISYMLGVSEKTAQYWKDGCLDSANEWPKESKLSGHVWIDEMRFAPTRASGFVDGVWTTYAGKTAEDAYMEMAFDSSGRGFCKLFSEKLGTPTRGMVLSALSGMTERGSTLTHDGAPSHNPLVRELGLRDDWCKFLPGGEEYEAKMKLLSNCSSHLRHSFESHSGIKAFKLESYCNFFMHRWSHVRKAGMKNAVEYIFMRVCGTPKSHKYAESFSKTSIWS